MRAISHWSLQIIEDGAVVVIATGTKADMEKAKARTKAHGFLVPHFEDRPPKLPPMTVIEDDVLDESLAALQAIQDRHDAQMARNPANTPDVPTAQFAMFPAEGQHQICVGKHNGIYCTYSRTNGEPNIPRYHSDRNTAFHVLDHIVELLKLGELK